MLRWRICEYVSFRVLSCCLIRRLIGVCLCAGGSMGHPRWIFRGVLRKEGWLLFIILCMGTDLNYARVSDLFPLAVMGLFA
jgi:hypothetical protein